MTTNLINSQGGTSVGKVEDELILSVPASIPPFSESYMSVTATMTSPCSGTQTLDKVNNNLYQGLFGDFTLGVLASDPTLGWTLVIYDYSSTTAPCYPSVLYGQVTPDSSDPTGTYGKMVNGSPDTTAGVASI